jgi:hypothetical protein
MPQYDDPFWTIIVLAVIVLAGVWAHNHHDKPSGANGASDPRGPEIGGPPSAEVKRAPHERKAGNGGDDSNKTERAIRNWTAILAVSGVFAAIFAAFTLNAIRGQLDVMEKERRPWISANVSLVDPVIFTEWNNSKGINVQLKFILKNHGDSPAINVRIWPQIMEHPGNPNRNELDGAQNKICQDTNAQANADPIGGFAIFPNDEITREGPNIGISGQMLFNKRQLFAILGCINYTYAGNRRGETGYRFLLGQEVGHFILGVAFQDPTWTAGRDFAIENGRNAGG